MNPPQSFHPWVAPLGWLALETSLVVLAALALQPLLRTAAARRSLWRAALLALLAVLVAELTGTGSQLPAQLRTAWQTTLPAPVPPADPLPAPEQLAFTPPPDFSLAPIGGEGRGEGAATALEPLPSDPAALLPAPVSTHHSITPPLHSTASALPAFLWLTGLAALLARAAWTHAGFAWLRLRHFLPAAEALRDRVQALAARLGLRRRVRVLASARLHAPAAFGWLRPGVAVPGDFTARFAPAQQDVMLAHELAHLAARDPLWQLLADLAVAALWWHPLAWVARHQHRLAAELAADDASQALPDGPVVLAECLLALGQEAAAAPRAPLGMAGFRSQLGRRVQRLVTLPRRDWQPPTRLRLTLQTTTALLALATLALLPGCAANRSASEAPSELVTKWWQAKKSPVGDDVRSLQSPQTQDPRPKTQTASQRLVTSSPTPVQLAAASPKGVTLPVPNPSQLTHSSKGAQVINRKLDQIVLPEVHFDAVPLVGVVQRLIEDAKQFDPEPDPKKKGLNFLINDVAPAAPLLDAAGNPVPVARPVALSEGLVRVTQPLKNLTLRQALDVICKTAELPTQFSVEEYAIAFIPRGPVAYYSRIFRVNPDTFIQGLQGVVATPVLGVTPGGNNAAGAAGQNQPTTATPAAPVRATVPATVPATQRTTAEANALVRQFFQSAGVTALGATNGSTRMTFNPANGLLQVRGTTNDLRLIEQAIQKVQPSGAARPDSTPQVTPTTRTNAPTSSTPSSPAKPVVKIETRIFKLEESLKNLTGVSLANSLRLDSPGLFTNQVVRAADVRSQFSPPLTTNQLPADGRMECEYYEARTQLAVVMSAARREALLNSLARSREWDAWSAPTLRTASGFRGQVQSVDINSVVVGQPKPETMSKHVVTVATGVTLDLLPTLTADASALRLGYLADVREFLGYAPTSKNPPEAVPRFRVRQAVGTNTLAIGESLLLTVAATVPLPGSGPGAAPGGAERTLLVLLTATLEESSGQATTDAAPRAALPNPIFKTNNSPPFLTHSSKGAQRINAKLDEIILPEIHFNSVTLPDVVVWLDGNVKRHDPEKKGLNFLINNVMADSIRANSTPSPVAPVRDLKGSPIALPATEGLKPDLEIAFINVARPIKDLTLRQALDVICKTATVKMPDGRNVGLKYSIEEYAIVFSAKLPEMAARFSRMFKVDPETFIEGLRAVVFDEKELKPGSRAALEQALREKAWTNSPTNIKQLTAGKPSLTNGVFSAANTNLTAEIGHLVRRYFTAAGVSNLGVTNSPDATQIFFNDRNGLLLVRASLEDLDIIQQAIELLNVKPPQVMIEAKFVEVNQNDSKALGFDWAQTNAPPAATITGILTAQQFAVVLKALEQRAAATLVSLPKVTTPSGKQAVVELPAAAKAAGVFAKGLKLEVIPSVEADGYTIGFTVKVTRDGKQVLESRATVWDAQTLMLGGLELPGAAAKPGAKPPRLMLFLTPTIVEPSGHRVHTDDLMPFAPAAPAKR